MESLFYFFNQNNVIFELWGYKMSMVELLATAFNFVAVWLSAKEKVSSWWLGIIGVTLFGILFFQINLYADMFLQIFFFVTNCIGWYQWTHPPKGLENQRNELKVTLLNPTNRFINIISILFLTIILGRFFAHIHEYLPDYFQKPASFPYTDSFIMAGSIIAQVLLMRKKLESWVLWIIVDVVAIAVYAQKEIYLTSILYFLFLLIAIQGLIEWRRSLKVIH